MKRPTELDQLVIRAQGGEIEAFDSLVSLYRDRLTGFFRMLLLDPRRAEELAQDTLSQLYMKLHCYDPRGTFDAWLFSVARHLAIDGIRREKLRKRVDAGDQQEWFADADRRGTRAFPMPGESLEREETIELVRTALDKVPAVYRETLKLADIEGLPYETIASRLGTTVGTVKSRVFRGRAALAMTLEVVRSRMRLESLVA